MRPEQHAVLELPFAGVLRFFPTTLNTQVAFMQYVSQHLEDTEMAKELSRPLRCYRQNLSIAFAYTRSIKYFNIYETKTVRSHRPLAIKLREEFYRRYKTVRKFALALPTACSPLWQLPPALIAVIFVWTQKTRSSKAPILPVEVEKIVDEVFEFLVISKVQGIGTIKRLFVDFLMAYSKSFLPESCFTLPYQRKHTEVVLKDVTSKHAESASSPRKELKNKMKSRLIGVKKAYKKSIKDTAACLSNDEKDEAMKLLLTYCPHAEKHPEEVTIFLAFTQNYMVYNSLSVESAANISLPFVWHKIVIGERTKMTPTKVRMTGFVLEGND
eukprot:IDg6768t1